MVIFRRGLAIALLVLLGAATARAQVGATGSITGAVSDPSGGVLPGATVTLTGEKLIGGAQTQVTDATGTYRFDRLPPGAYTVKVELQGFKTVTRDDIRVDASFVATVNARMEVGSLNESVTVTGESPTIDTKSNLQQTVMNQEILEGVPSGRDPWSVAKIIPGVAISTYDVGGTQSFQQSSLSSHGSNTNDVSYNIDGATVNWPGGGGGATMLYYDQGMFEEVNYMTSAIPAETLAGGVAINMVTKDGGNKWRGNVKYYYSSQNLQSDNTHAAGLPANFPGNPVKNLYDFNIAGGGGIVQDKFWVNGSIRRWVVNKFVAAKNPDGSQALDDNTLKNYSGKATYAISPNQKATFSYNWNNKIRGHRRDTPPNLVPDIASLVQTNPASSTQAKYAAIFNKKTVFESSFSIMKGETDYGYQPGTPSTAIRATDSAADAANFASQRQEAQPNSRTQFDNILSYTKSGWGGDHLIKGGVQFARLYFDDRYNVLNGLYLNYTSGKATSVTEYNTPTESTNISRVLGGFIQDSWTIASRLTLNLGMRFDHNTGEYPAQSTTGGPFIGPQNIPAATPINQSLAVWRTGLVYDPLGDGRTAVKASYSRYGLQVGIDRVTNVNPLFAGTRSCPWSDPNPLDVLHATSEPSLETVLSEVNTAQCSGFPGLRVHYANPNGPKWPYSDELTAGLEREVIRNMRLGVMYYHRTNRNQIGVVNAAVTPDMYVPVTVNVPNGPNGPMTQTVYNLASPSFNSLANYQYQNSSYLDTDYNGLEITANKRFSNRWQMVAGLTFGANKGGLNTGGTATGQTNSLGTVGTATEGDLNDPNATLYHNGYVGYDSKVQFRMSGSYVLPYNISVAGSLISNTGYPYSSTYTVTRTVLPSLVRASQVIFLSNHSERLPAVTSIDLRFSRAFRFGSRQIVPQVDIFNIANSAAIVGLNPAVPASGSTYLAPNQILSPRIVKVGFSVDF